MTNVAAPVWNQIAREQPLETEAAKLAFAMDQDQLAKLEDRWAAQERQAGTPENLVGRVITCLPLVVESFAIQQFVSQHPQFRDAFPEMNSPEEAASLMQLEWRLTDEERETLTKVLSSPEAVERWQIATLAVE